MKKILGRILLVFIIIITIYLNICNVQAKDIWDIGRKFLETGAGTTGMTEENRKILELTGENTKAKFEELIDFLWGIGLLVIFIGAIILGIKYMFVLPNEKSRIKQATIPYVIGTVIIFGALTIWKLIILILDGSL